MKPYIGVYGGMAFPENFDDVKGRGVFSSPSFSDLKLNSGPMVGLKIGFTGPPDDKVARWLGLEIDGSYLESDIKEQDARVSGPGGSLAGRIDEAKVN